MKALKIAFLSIVILVSAGYSAYILLEGPCFLPKEYRLGEIDPRFGISREEALSAAREAEGIWEKALGRDLFSYDESKGIPINLVYDERQATTDKNKKIESRIQATEKTAASVKREFESLKERYAAAKEAYASILATFEFDKKAYDESVSYWNSRGGAPKNEYDKLEAEKANLETAYAALEDKRKEVNSLAAEVNQKVSGYNSLVESVNQGVDAINQSADKEFEQGDFQRNGGKEKIDIFTFTGRADLVRVLAHEFGHALGSDHNSDPDSIMYYLNTSKNVKPTTEDVAGIRASCSIRS